MLSFCVAIENIMKNVGGATSTVLNFAEYGPEERNSALLRTLHSYP